MNPPFWPTPAPYAGTTLNPGPTWSQVLYVAIVVWILFLWIVGIGTGLIWWGLTRRS